MRVKNGEEEWKQIYNLVWKNIIYEFDCIIHSIKDKQETRVKKDFVIIHRSNIWEYLGR